MFDLLILTGSPTRPPCLCWNCWNDCVNRKSKM